jgi:hypothetical protein
VINLRIAAAVFLMSVAACGDGGTESRTGAMPSIAASAPTVASAPRATESPTPVAVVGPVDDRTRCAAADRAAKAMTASLLRLYQQPSGWEPVEYVPILNDMEAALTAVAQGDGKAAAAVRQLAAEYAKAAEDPNPSEAAITPAFERAENDVVAACRATGVTVEF